MFKKLGYAALVAITAVAFVIGSAATGEAKAKKKKAAPPPLAPWCALIEQPVCALKGKQKFTYFNACFATMDGAKSVSQKACPVKTAKKKVTAKKPIVQRARVSKPAKRRPARKK